SRRVYAIALPISSLILEVHVTNQLAEPHFVTIAQHTRLVRDQTLAVEVGPVHAAQVNQSQRILTTPDRGMNARNAFFLGAKRRQVKTEVRSGGAVAVCAAQDHLLFGLQDERFRRISNVDNDRRLPSETGRSPGVPADQFAGDTDQFVGRQCCSLSNQYLAALLTIENAFHVAVCAVGASIHDSVRKGPAEDRWGKRRFLLRDSCAMIVGFRLTPPARS